MTDNFLLVSAALIIGLCLGSFLNVVIYRLPVQMQSAWRRESLDFLGMDDNEPAPSLNIAFPASQCPHCGRKLKPWHNIPVASFVFLRGKCAFCATPISLQYPLVELTCGLLAALVIALFGLTATGLLALVFTLTLVTLTAIDINHHLLPDILTLPLLWLGLLVNSQGLFTDLNSAVIGAVAGYLSLWSVYWLFKLLTGKEGMGHGDFKLLAALGAWAGWQGLPLIILLSSLVGAVVGIALLMLQGRDKSQPLAFGPYLAVSGWIGLLWGEKITGAYLGMLH